MHEPNRRLASGRFLLLMNEFKIQDLTPAYGFG